MTLSILTKTAKSTKFNNAHSTSRHHHYKVIPMYTCAMYSVNETLVLGKFRLAWPMGSTCIHKHCMMWYVVNQLLTYYSLQVYIHHFAITINIGLFMRGVHSTFITDEWSHLLCFFASLFLHSESSLNTPLLYSEVEPA